MLNIRRPAHSSIIPKTSKWTDLTDLELEILGQYVEINSSVIIQKRKVENSKDVFGYYKYQGDQNFFIKIISKQDYISQSVADEISMWLFNTGVNVGVAKKNLTKKIKDLDCWIYIYKYLYHNFDTRNSQDMYLVGQEVGRMHRMMRDYPYKEKIIKNGKNKNRQLYDIFKDIKSNRCFPWFSDKAISLIKNCSYEEYNTLEQFPQIIHGDLNIGNIIFSIEDQNPVIIDFEDSAVSWLNPIYDIAFVMQRFILLSGIGNRVELASFFIDGYKSQCKIKISNGQIYSMLKMISVRSLLILSTLSKDDLESYKGEVDKFVSLYQRMAGDYLTISKVEDLF